MKLLKAKISSFRSVAEATLHVDPRVTILVGPNEGGKTNILRALESFAPDKEFVETAVCQFSPAYTQGQSPEIQLLFGDFSTNDAETLTQVLEAEQSRLSSLQKGGKHVQIEAIVESQARNMADDTTAAELTDSPEITSYSRSRCRAQPSLHPHDSYETGKRHTGFRRSFRR